jgi:ribonuclease E
VPTAVALYILNHKRDALVQTEARYGFHVVIGSDDTLVPPAFRLERLRALTPAEIAALPLPVSPPIEAEDDEFSADEVDEDEAESSDEAVAPAPPAPLPVEAFAAADEAAKPQDGHGDDHRESHDEARGAGAPQGDGGRRRRRRRRRGGRRGDDVRETSPAPAAAAPEHGAEPAAAEEFDEGDEVPGEFAPAPSPASEAGENGDANKRRRRRGRRGGRRRRRGEGDREGLPAGAEDQPMTGASDRPVEAERVEAERVEYVYDEPQGDNAAAEMVDALAASPGPAMRDNGAESVPVADQGDHIEEAPPAAPASAAAADEAPAASQPPAHDVTGPPANPKKGWWRRVMDS